MFQLKICSVCNTDPLINYLECLHTICKNCFLKKAQENFSQMMCNLCATEISNQYKKEFLGKEFENFENQSVKNIIKENMIICPNKQCNEQISFEKGRTDYSVKNEKGEFLNKKAAEHYAANRCRCPYCKHDFCVGCKISPYHMGKLHKLKQTIRFYLSGIH